MSTSKEFSLSLNKYRSALKHLLTINKDLVFGNGLICALRNGRSAFSAIRIDSFDSSDFSIRDCTDLDNMINSKQFDKITLDLLAQKITASNPYKFSINVPTKDDYVEADNLGMIGEVKKRLEILEDVASAESENVFEDSSGETHKLCNLIVDNAVFVDMIERVFLEDFDLTLETSNFELKLSNEKRSASLPLSASLPQTKIVLSAGTYIVAGTLQILKSALQAAEEKQSKITIADSAILMVQNETVTIINTITQFGRGV
jgi:hypothetical protein